MLTIVLQFAVTLAFLAYGVLALAVSRHRLPWSPFHQGAWRLVGTVVTVHSCIQLAQNVWGTWAFLAGEGSAAWDGYMRWNGALNHSRTGMWLVFYALFLVYVLGKKPRGPRFWRAVVALFPLGLLAGTLLGRTEYRLDNPVDLHFTAVAFGDVLEMFLLFAVLFLAMVRNRLDRYLWAALGVQALLLPLHVLYTIVLGRVEREGGWQPPVWSLPTFRLVFCLAMATLAYRRLVLARRGALVPGLMDTSRRPPTFSG